VNPFPEGAEPQGVTNTCVIGLPHNEWLCNECTSPRFAVYVCEKFIGIWLLGNYL